ncbi:MAG TPA: helix-turn-helix domain-containing protein [Candidatus Nanoarchaeia archaeon]|nr:helix-turn-helix domain-containing protein [Candidatus Nanoarchaeia archaeon]
MWRTKVRLKHSCLFGDNCKEAKVTCLNMSFNTFKKGDSYFVFHMGTVFGDNYTKFLALLKKDRRVDYIESDGRTFVVLEKRPEKEIPGMVINNEVIYVKPVKVDEDGYETWELAAIEKEKLMDFINHFKDSEILNIEQTKLKDIYFPRLSPNFSQHQRDALELAIEEGYYQFPKKTDLNKLSKIARLSKSTFREHLKRAEMKVLGELGR